MTQVEFMKIAAARMIEASPPCPWNPFPRNSRWGREIEDRYQQDEADRRLRTSQDKGEPSNG